MEKLLKDYQNSKPTQKINGHFKSKTNFLSVFLYSLMIKQAMMYVVYFDQQTGAPHAVYWSKSFSA